MSSACLWHKENVNGSVLGHSKQQEVGETCTVQMTVTSLLVNFSAFSGPFWGPPHVKVAAAQKEQWEAAQGTTGCWWRQGKHRASGSCWEGRSCVKHARAIPLPSPNLAPEVLPRSVMLIGGNHIYCSRMSGRVWILASLSGKKVIPASVHFSQMHWQIAEVSTVIC